MGRCKNRHIVNIVIVVLLSAVFCAGLYLKTYAGDKGENRPYLDIYYFHANPCEACHEDTKFIDKFKSLVGDASEGVNFNIYVEDIFKESAVDLFKELCDKYDVPRDRRKAPAVFIGNIYIQGDTEIDEQLKDGFLTAKANFLEKHPGASGTQDRAEAKPDADYRPDAADAESAKKLKSLQGTDTNIIFFYVTACEACEKLKAVLKELKPSYGIDYNGEYVSSRVNIIEYNAGEMESLNLSKLYFKAYDVPEKDQLVPLIFIGNKYFSGGKTGIGELEKTIKKGEGTRTPVKISGGAVLDSGVKLSGYSYAGIFFTGLINGLNPCSLSMLLFFFSLLLARSIHVLKYGLAFITGKFITYLALGTVAYNLFLYMDGLWLHEFQNAVKFILLAVIAIFTVMNIKDFFAARKENYGNVRLQLPSRLRKMNHKWIQKLTSCHNAKLLLIMCFSLGIMISAGEFLCTGQIYLATIIFVLKSSRTLNLQAVSSFITYVLAMMIPLLAVTFIIQKGKELLELSEIIRGRLPLIKLINAIIFLLFAVAIFIFF